MIRFLVAPLIVSLCLAVALHLADGYLPGQDNQRIHKQVSLIDGHYPANEHPKVLQKPTIAYREMLSPDYIIGVAEEPTVLLWGDSNAAHFVGMFEVLLEGKPGGLRNVSHSACPPVLGDVSDFVSPRYLKRCDRSRFVVGEQLHRYETIVLSASWETYLRRKEEFWGSFVATVDTVLESTEKVVIIGYLQRMPVGFDRSCLSKKSKVPMIDCGEESLIFPGPSEYRFKQLARELADERSDVTFFDPNEFICPDGICSAFVQEELVYHDRGHLSYRGSVLLGRRIRQAVGVPGALVPVYAAGVSSGE
jgi:hypothetical protein